MSMLTAERRKIIIEKLQAEKKVIVSQLSDFFCVSDETIRRDLDRLCQEGLAIKSYGGAILNDNAADLPFSVRKSHNLAEKQKISELVETLVKEGDSILLDASTTAVFVAKALKRKKRLTVITNSIEVMLELADMRDWTVISTGGQLMGDYLAFGGQRASLEISSIYADKLIFSCQGLDVERGIFDSNDDLAQLKCMMLKSSKIKILAVDSSKFGKNSFSKIANISDIDIVVTDAIPDKGWIECFSNHHVEFYC